MPIALCDQEGAIGFHGKIRKSGENRIYGENPPLISNLHPEYNNSDVSARDAVLKTKVTVKRLTLDHRC